jgi:hypothetical protein
VPPSPWLDNEPPSKPVVSAKIENDRVNISWDHTNFDDVFRWVVYFKYETGNWDYKILSADARKQYLQKEVGDKKRKLQKIGVTAVDRSGNQSEFFEIQIN